MLLDMWLEEKAIHKGQETAALCTHDVLTASATAYDIRIAAHKRR